MKRIKTLSAMMIALVASFVFTSCDEDPWHHHDEGWNYNDYSQDWYDDYDWYNQSFNYGTDNLTAEASALRGYWSGTIENRYVDDNNQQQAVQMNATFEFDQYNTSSLNGRGRETDVVYLTDDSGNPVYDSDGNQQTESQELRFTWYIDPRTGDIYLKYDTSNMTYAAAYQGGFRLDTQSGEFYGTFVGQNNSESIVFDLQRTTLAKPNVELGADTTTGTTGLRFGTLDGGAQKMTAPMALRKR